MTIEKTLIALQEVLNEKDYIKAAGIHEDEHNPHPFHVDEDHKAYARDANDGVLTEDILEMFPCAHPDGCKVNYRDHKARRTLMLQLKKDITNQAAEGELIKIKPLLIKYAVQRVAFVDTEKGYKFL